MLPSETPKTAEAWTPEAIAAQNASRGNAWHDPTPDIRDAGREYSLAGLAGPCKAVEAETLEPYPAICGGQGTEYIAAAEKEILSPWHTDHESPGLAPLPCLSVSSERAAKLHPTGKESNPKDVIGSSKVPFHLVPHAVVAEVALALLEGACKYGAHNYRVVGVKSSIYTDATRRHLSAFEEGEDDDPDSELSHITKAIASLTVLRDAMIRGMWTDDRPPKTRGFIAALNEKAKRILAKFPNPKAPFLASDGPAKDYNG